MPSLNLADADIHYLCLGPEPSESVPVIMIHGLLVGNSATWYFGTANALAKSHRVIVYDLRGHGMSAKAKQGYDLRTMVHDLKALVESQGFMRVALVGHSYGALIALHFAKEFPAYVDRLVLVEGPLPPGRGLQIEEFLGLSSTEQAAALPKDVREQLAKGGRQARKLLDRLSFLVTETELIENLKAESDITDAELEAIDVPVQLIYGTESQLGDVAHRLDRTLPRSELQWLPGGHYLPSESPRELTTLIGGFFP
jgi:esterase